MIKEYFHIAHLISRHLSGEVTPEESRFLDKWRKESKSHEQLFQKICSDEHYAQHEIRKMEFDSQAGWKGVETRIKRMELRRRHLKLLLYVALFIAPVFHEDIKFQPCCIIMTSYEMIRVRIPSPVNTIADAVKYFDFIIRNFPDSDIIKYQAASSICHP